MIMVISKYTNTTWFKVNLKIFPQNYNSNNWIFEIKAISAKQIHINNKGLIAKLWWIDKFAFDCEWGK